MNRLFAASPAERSVVGALATALLILISLSIGGCDEQETSTLRTCRNVERGFSIQYPSSMTITKLKQASKSTFVLEVGTYEDAECTTLERYVQVRVVKLQRPISQESYVSSVVASSDDMKTKAENRGGLEDYEGYSKTTLAGNAATTCEIVWSDVAIR